MRKLVAVTMAAVALAGSVSAQAPEQALGSFRPGVLYAGPRLWLGNLNGALAVGGQVERGLTQPAQYGPGLVSGGVGIDYYSWSHDYALLGKYSYSVIPLQLFSNYHFPVGSNSKLDPYLGVSLVYSMVSSSWDGQGTAADAEASSLGFAGQGGVRYFISDKFAVQGQVGFGYGTLGVGTSWRF
jgi:hypothetical protein